MSEKKIDLGRDAFPEAIKNAVQEILDDYFKWLKGNKAAGRRFRVGSVKLEKLLFAARKCTKSDE